jgi:16S rRNA (guanine527-N7)-methyltransferase
VTGDHAPALLALGLPAETVAALARYLDLLAAWNARVNLTGASTSRERVGTLVAEVLPAAELLEPGSILDVGSGNGSPGLVLALLRPELSATLLEPRARRWAFLLEAARSVGRPDIRVLRVRHDAYPGPPARNLTLRGLALPLADLGRLVEEGGRLLVFGGRPRTDAAFVLEGDRPLPRTRLWAFRRARFT